MTQDTFATLSALIDGEPVDPGQLRATLRLPGANEALVAFATLRWQAHLDNNVPGTDFYRTIAFNSPARLLAKMPRHVGALAAAAALVLLSAAAGMLVGRHVGPRLMGQPPRTERAVHFVPGVDWQAVAERTTQ